MTQQTIQDQLQLINNLYGLADQLGKTALKALKFAESAIPENGVGLNGPATTIAATGIQALQAGTEAVKGVQEIWIMSLELARRAEEAHQEAMSGSTKENDQ